jgi:preprotein translocase SecE subunit
MVNTSMTNTAQQPEEPNGGKSKGQDAPKSKGGLPTPKLNRGPKQFYNEVVREMKKVSWPTRAETNRLTMVVLTVCLLVGAILSGLGFLFGLIIDLLTTGRIG